MLVVALLLTGDEEVLALDVALEVCIGSDADGAVVEDDTVEV